MCDFYSFNSRARVGRDAIMCDFYKVSAVSIHAPAWGATRATPTLTVKESVSIHAPAWGATGGYRERFIIEGGFNSRARVGRDSGRTSS